MHVPIFPFSLGFIKQPFQSQVRSILDFVYYVRWIVNALKDKDMMDLYARFFEEIWTAINGGICHDMVLDRFRDTVKNYGISNILIEAFLKNTQLEIDKSDFTSGYNKKYIYNSDEAIALMCLRVFYANDNYTYNHLHHTAEKFGNVIHRINILKKIKTLEDPVSSNTILSKQNPTLHGKNESPIEADLREVRAGIAKLKPEVRTGVYMIYLYYQYLFRYIQNPKSVNRQRFTRLPITIALYILLKAKILSVLNPVPE